MVWWLWVLRSHVFVRIDTGLGLFIVALLIVPLLDVFYLRGRIKLYNGIYVTVGAMGLCSLVDALVQGGVIGATGEMPKRYMQANVAGAAALGQF